MKLISSIITQTEYQRKMLSQNFGRESIVIKNPLPSPNNGIPDKNDPPIVLWVATIKHIKQADLYLQLAKAIPEVKFQMIGSSVLDEERICDLHFVARHSKLAPFSLSMKARRAGDEGLAPPKDFEPQ